MDLRKEFRNLVTNKYMPGYDYGYKKFSFRTVHYVSNCKNIYCMCACAYELEFLDFISDKGVIDEIMYDRVVENLFKGKCLHVDSARCEFVRETCIYAKHIAMAVGTLDALNKRGPHFRLLIDGAYKKNVMEMGLLKNSVRSIDEVLRNLDGDIPDILDIECLEGVREDLNKDVLEIKQTDAVAFCIENKYTDMLKCILNTGIGHKPYNIASALCIAMKRKLQNIQFYLIQYITDIACDIAYDPDYAKNRYYEVYRGLYQKYCADCAVLFGDTVLLKRLLETSDMNLTQMVKLAHTAWLLNRRQCNHIILSFLQAFRPLNSPLTHVDYIQEMIDLFVRFNDGFENEIKAGISTMLNYIIGSDNKNITLSNTRNPSLIHLYLLDPAEYFWYRQLFPRSYHHHISVLADLDDNINCLYLEYGTALNYVLNGRLHDKKFREILETLIFENSDIELNPTAVQSGLRIDLENQKKTRTDYSVEEGNYIMDGKLHGLFEAETGDDVALNLTAPLLIECGYNLSPYMFDFLAPEPDNVSNILPDVKVYIRQCLETPRRLTHCCRDVLRKHFKGKQIHRFVEAADMPKPIQDFILLKPVLRCIFPVKKE